MNAGNNRKTIKTGMFELGMRIYIQECRKWNVRHESAHVLFVCQNRDIHCSGAMSAVLDSYDLKTSDLRK